MPPWLECGRSGRPRLFERPHWSQTAAVAGPGRVRSAIATSIVAAPDSLPGAPGNPLFTLGAPMMVRNPAVVIGIGILLFPILRPHDGTVAFGYFGIRIFEAILLTVGALGLLRVTVARGLSNSEIATELFITLSTVKTHLASVMAKLGAHNRVEIAIWAH